MSSAITPLPIARRGLKAIRDNVPAGMQVGGFAADFALIFRDELLSRPQEVLCQEHTVIPATGAVSPA